MGHSKQSKQQHHEQIVTIAAKRFREKGLEGLSISDVMQEAGLTHGGFYKHFASREELVVEAVDCALNASRTKLNAAALNYPQFVQQYLSSAHRDAVGEGCAMAALVNDLARSQTAAKGLYTQQLSRTLEHLQTLLGSDTARAMVVFSTLTGALSMARAVDDEVLSQQILNTVCEHLLTAN